MEKRKRGRSSASAAPGTRKHYHIWWWLLSEKWIGFICCDAA